MKKGEETQKALDELTKQLSPNGAEVQIPNHRRPSAAPGTIGPMPAAPYKIGDSVATREAFGAALEALGSVNPSIVALDADVKNSTYTDKFGKKFPNRFFESFIAEQNMVGAAAGLAACGKIPFVATFACFLQSCLRLHPHGRHQRLEHQTRRDPRRRQHRRRRAVTNGAGRHRDDGSATKRDGALSLGWQLDVSIARSRREAQGNGLSTCRKTEDPGPLWTRGTIPYRRQQNPPTERIRCPHDRGRRRDAVRSA